MARKRLYLITGKLLVEAVLACPKRVQRAGQNDLFAPSSQTAFATGDSRRASYLKYRAFCWKRSQTMEVTAMRVIWKMHAWSDPALIGLISALGLVVLMGIVVILVFMGLAVAI